MSESKRQVSTLAIIFHMMAKARKNYLPVKFLKSSQLRLFDSAMRDQKLLQYDLKLFISDEDIFNMIANSENMLQYDSSADVILLSEGQNIDDLVSKYSLDDYIISIICPTKR